LIGKDGKLSQTRMSEIINKFLSHISGETIKWTDNNTEWEEGMKLELTDDLKVKYLHHKYLAGDVGDATIRQIPEY
jgi:hypothetical protein